MIFWKILLAHALTDFVFQPDSLAENKGKIAALLIHTLIFFLLSVLLLGGTWGATSSPLASARPRSEEERLRLVDRRSGDRREPPALYYIPY